ncbi:ankyrin repeat-containing domain protein [Aspergillus heterothallicus]
MAEALGVAVNIAAVLQVATEIAQLSYSYARAVKNAPKTQKQYLQEVSALMEVLFRVEQAVQDAETTDLPSGRPPSLSDETLMDCYRALSNLQFDLLRRRSRFLQPFHEKEWRAHIDMLHKYRSLFADFVASCILVTGNATFRKISALSQEQDRNLLLTWLPPSNAAVRQRPSSCPGTGSSFFDQKAVVQWVKRSSGYLWCYGSPGVGKSCLASLMVDHLAASLENCTVASFFCDFSSQDQQSTLQILNHLLRQIIEQETLESLALIKEACTDPGKLQNASTVAHLISIAGSSQPTYIVLDAVDELRDPTALLSHIPTFVSAGVNVLVTSRDLPHIRKTMKLASHLKITSSPDDLRLYVESRFRDSDFSGDIEDDPTLLDSIISISGNLFLLARLILDDVLELSSLHQIRRAIARPQFSLQQAFEGTMARIDAQSKARSSLARRLLGWITYAVRRLTVEEILCAFCVEDEDEDELDPNNRPNFDILLRSCLGLVVIDPIDKTVGLVHTTAYEFLRSGVMNQTETNADMAATCLRYLTMNHVAAPCQSAAELSRRFGELTFLSYAAKSWGRHIQDGETGLEALILRHLCSQGYRDSAFQALQWPDGAPAEPLAEAIFQSIPIDQQALHVAAYWGLGHVCNVLITAAESVSSLDSHKFTPLHWACSRNHRAVADVLLRNGAKVNAQDIQGWTPLFWASFRGNADLVELLLAHGGDHLIRSSLGWTALHWAVSSGHLNCVKPLLEHHAHSQPEQPKFHKMGIEEVEAYADSVPPVDIASDGNDAEIFDLLLQHVQTPSGEVGDAQFNEIWSSSRFDAPASVNPWRTMTKGEQLNGREYVVPRLSGWNADGPSGYRANAVTWKSVLLLSAIRDEHLSSVQLLIQAGADVHYGHALQIAACREDPRYVRCLLDAGADPSKYDDSGRTALHEAVLNGFFETITALIDGGADVNQPMRDKTRRSGTWMRGMFNTLDGSTPLIQACGFTFVRKPDLALTIARLLLSRGADATLQDTSGMTALHYAVMRPYPELIKLLIDFGCSLDATEADGRMPIHILATCQDTHLSDADLREVLRLILGADPSNMAEGRLNMPAIGRPGQRRRRVDLGDTSYPSEQELAAGRTPLYIALKNKRWRISHLFCEFGAQIPNHLDLAPILAAAAEDLDMVTVDLLLDHGAVPPESLVSTMISSLNKKPTAAIAPTDPCSAVENILRKISAAGAKVDHRSETGDTPLTTLISSPHEPETFAIVEQLVTCGADVLASSNTVFDPILAAALYGDERVLHYLLECATRVNNQDHWSKYFPEVGQEPVTDLQRVCMSLQQASVLDRVNGTGRTLLHLAAETGNVAFMKTLLSCGARPDIADADGFLPVHRAGFAHRTAAIQTLLPVGTDVPAQADDHAFGIPTSPFWLDALKKTNDNDSNILHCAVRENNFAMADHLLAYGMDPNTRMSNGWNNGPLICYAAYNGRAELLSTLLAHGADITATDKYGWNALHNACHAGYADIARTLIEAGADVHTATVQWNNPSCKPSGIYEGNAWPGRPLHLAVMAGNAELVRILLDKGVDIGVSTFIGQEYFGTPSQGPTALYLALDTGTYYGRRGRALDEDRLTIARWLVDRGEMVQGVISQFKMRDVLKFKNFPDLWDALRQGERAAKGSPAG